MTKTYMAAYIVAMASVYAASAASATTAGNYEGIPLEISDISTEVVGHSKSRYLDLLKQIFPDLAVMDGGAISRKAITLRHIAGGYGDVLKNSISIRSLQVLEFESKGSQRIAILVNIGETSDQVEQPAVLAIFDGSAHPRLLDVVDVGMDRISRFGMPALVKVGQADQAIVTYSQHFNSNESFTSTALSFMREGKLSLVDTFHTYGLRTCGKHYSQILTFRSENHSSHEPYFSITASVEESQKVTKEKCMGEPEAVPYSKRISDTYYWISEKLMFSPDTDAIKELQERSADQF